MRTGYDWLTTQQLIDLEQKLAERDEFPGAAFRHSTATLRKLVAIRSAAAAKLRDAFREIIPEEEQE